MFLIKKRKERKKVIANEMGGRRGWKQKNKNYCTNCIANFNINIRTGQLQYNDQSVTHALVMANLLCFPEESRQTFALVTFKPRFLSAFICNPFADGYSTLLVIFYLYDKVHQKGQRKGFHGIQFSTISLTKKASKSKKGVT